MAKLYFYYASMNAGKSTTLLQADFNYRERGMATMLWTAAFDDRGGARAIESRIGLAADAHRYDAKTDLWARVSGAHAVQPLACVLVDEAQFLSQAQVWQLARLADEANIPVLCYGLRTDFRGELFPGSGALLGIADALVELKTVCHCGRKATMNLRVDESGAAVRDGAQTEIGGNDRYVALCRRHFSEALGGEIGVVDDGLHQPLTDGTLQLLPLAEAHREGLRRACAEDLDIWDIYPFNYLGDDFDPQFERMLAGGIPRRCYAIVLGGEVVGMTAWIEHGAPGWSIEIGNSYIVPRLRGSGLNARFKRLMLDHAFACGLERVAFKVDAINARSRAAVRKLGCTEEGLLRHERRTWTGRVRDTVIYGILRREWEQRQS